MRKYYVELAGTGTILQTDNPELWPDAKRLTAADGARRLKEEALAYLRKTLRPGDTVYCVLNHVSKSGMQRRISFKIVRKNQPLDITGSIGRACGYAQSDKGGLIVGGCGMDMGFSVVYNLGRTVYPNGTKKPHGRRNGEPDTDGGYALHSTWL